jgi:hypothetical protein
MDSSNVWMHDAIHTDERHHSDEVDSLLGLHVVSEGINPTIEFV